MMDEMVADGRLSASKRRDMEAYVTRSVAEHNRGEETAWYEAMSFAHEEGAALTAQGCPSEDLRLEAQRSRRAQRMSARGLALAGREGRGTARTNG